MQQSLRRTQVSGSRPATDARAFDSITIYRRFGVEVLGVLIA